MFKIVRSGPCRVATVAVVALPSLVIAQETTFNACRVPDVGVIYMIGVEGVPSECLSPSHVQFSWTEGAVPADGSIGTAQLADGAVTAAKLADGLTIGVADGSVGTTQLADGGVTATKLAEAAVTSAAVADNTLVAADLADGSVGTGELQDGAITEAKLDAGIGIPAGMVAFFAMESCPVGWTEQAAVSGRLIVGRGAGTLGGTVGTVFQDLEDRSHTHTVDPPSVATASDGNHAHVWSHYDDAAKTWESYLSPGTSARTVITDWGDGMDAAGTGFYPLSRSSTSDVFYTSPSGNHSHSVDLGPHVSSAATDLLPYIQYTACLKS